MSGTPLELINSPRRQGAGETRTHAFSLPSNFTPSTVTFTVIKLSDNSPHSSGSGAVSGSEVTLGGISGLTAGEKYRVNVSMTVGGQLFIRYFILECES